MVVQKEYKWEFQKVNQKGTTKIDMTVVKTVQQMVVQTDNLMVYEPVYIVDAKQVESTDNLMVLVLEVQMEKKKAASMANLQE